MAPAKKDAALSSLARSFVFYGSYHNEPVNQIIHIVFVWQILYSAFVMLAATPPLLASLGGTIPVPTLLGVELNLSYNWAFLAFVVYATFFSLIEIGEGFAGLLCAFLTAVGYCLGAYLYTNFGNEAFTWALRVHVISWLAQFYGHFVHEGRSPALFQNLAQALLFAPLFVVMEVLFGLGYRPNFYKQTKSLIGVQIAQWAKEKAAKAKAKT